MEHVIDVITGNTVYLVITILIVVMIVLAIVKRLFKLFLVTPILKCNGSHLSVAKYYRNKENLFTSNSIYIESPRCSAVSESHLEMCKTSQCLNSSSRNLLIASGFLFFSQFS